MCNLGLSENLWGKVLQERVVQVILFDVEKVEI